jgi:Flp pilus assembly protein TadD
MYNATLKRILFFLAIATMAGLAGCSSPEEKRAEQLETALELSRGGANEEALEILESLTLDYPNDAEVLRAIGEIYASDDDHTMAAFFLEQAHLQDPENVELLYRTYQSLDAAGQPSGESLEKLAALSPAAMSDELWLELGAHRAEGNQTEAALEAYLKGVNPDAAAPDTATAIGQLFARLDNYAQAANWFETAADSDAPSALTALFGLLEIQLSQKNWAEAEATITRLNKQFPGAIDASKWKQASDELKRWRAAQEQMKAKLAAAEAAKEKADQEAAADESEEVGEAEAAEQNGSEAEVAAGEGKAQVIGDLEAAEALANKPAEEAEESEAAITEGSGAGTGASTNESNAVAFNPAIAIEPAEPDFDISVDFEEAEQAAETTFRVEPEDGSATQVDADGLTSPRAAELEAIQPAIRPAERPKTLEELLAEAETAEMERDYKSAIRKYWAAISIVNNRAEVWNLLSRAYLVDGQLKNADTAALEAVRLAPREVAYTLDFLRVAQRSRPPEEFLAQLETAYDRFPASPEITLSLARAHERISEDDFVARNLYLRFIDIAPNHPLVPEARDAAARLR